MALGVVAVTVKLPLRTHGAAQTRFGLAQIDLRVGRIKRHYFGAAPHGFAESLRERLDQRTDSTAQAREQAPARAAGAAELAGSAGFRVAN